MDIVVVDDDDEVKKKVRDTLDQIKKAAEDFAKKKLIKFGKEVVGLPSFGQTTSFCIICKRNIAVTSTPPIIYQ